MLLNKRFATLSILGILLSCSTLSAQNSAPKAAPARAQAMPQNASTKEDSDKNVEIDMTKLSEAFGNFIGRNLKSPGLKFDLESIVKGIREGANGQPSPLSDKDYEKMMAAVQERAFKEMSTTNLKNANEFITKNKNEKGVIEIVPEKLQYSILKEGTGPTVEAHSSPKIHYTGKYQDGTVFGTSEEMGNPITIPLDQTIPGFSKGIVGMKEGEKRRLFVHPDLGYGTTGQLQPNELLIFDIEVVKANDDTKGKKPLGMNSEESEDESSDEDSDTSSSDADDEDVGTTKATTPATTPATKAAVKPANSPK